MLLNYIFSEFAAPNEANKIFRKSYKGDAVFIADETKLSYQILAIK